MQIHKEHRARVRSRFLQDGLDGFDEHQVLEMLLFYCIPRRDTNIIAHNLINRFGSLAQVIDAPVKELAKVDGVGEGTAVFISFLSQFDRYYNTNKNQEFQILNTIEDCGNYLLPYFNGRHKETVYMLCLDAKCKVLSCRLIEEGNVNSAGISIRKIVDMALTENATSVVLAHNHPSGLAVPSDEDIDTTVKIAKALRFVDVVLTDHIVVADGEFVSMVLSKYYNPNDSFNDF
ncbi:MAG: DNA repair protein RadC [Oscillospiraceae bacterium]|nr:DNA repair protein RadC [Oscillospiraceae bacterium]